MVVVQYLNYYVVELPIVDEMKMMVIQSSAEHKVTKIRNEFDCFVSLIIMKRHTAT
jgi:hypothetical protein